MIVYDFCLLGSMIMIDDHDNGSFAAIINHACSIPLINKAARYIFRSYSYIIVRLPYNLSERFITNKNHYIQQFGVWLYTHLEGCSHQSITCPSYKLSYYSDTPKFMPLKSGMKARVSFETNDRASYDPHVLLCCTENEPYSSVRCSSSSAPHLPPHVSPPSHQSFSWSAGSYSASTQVRSNKLHESQLWLILAAFHLH